MPSGLRSSDPSPGTDHQRHRAQHRGHRRHQDRPQAQQAGLADRDIGRQAVLALELQRDVDHQDRVFHDDADQQENPSIAIRLNSVFSAAAPAARRHLPTAASRES
jgi:hypothetical protein